MIMMMVDASRAMCTTSLLLISQEPGLGSMGGRAVAATFA